MTPSSRNARKWFEAALSAAAVVLAFFAAPRLRAQNFGASDVRIDAQGRIRISHTSDANSYFILFRGDSVTDIHSPADMALGSNQNGLFTDSGPSGTARFYQIKRLPLTGADDTDGDGIDDVWELRHPGQLNPLAAADAQQPSAGPGSPTWLEVYRSGQATTARFVAAASEVLVNAASASVAVAFSKAYNGPLRFQVGGTASPGQDYEIGGLDAQALTAQVLANGTETTIPIIIKDAATIDRDRTLVLTLLEPTAPNSYKLPPNALVTHSITIREATHGIFAGTMTFTNGVVLPPQSLKMALRADASGSQSEAYVDALASTFFRTNFSLPVSISGDGGKVTFSGFVSRAIELNSLGRPLTWTLSIPTAAITSNLLTAPVRLTVQGLSATPDELEALGSLLLTRLNPE